MRIKVVGDCSAAKVLRGYLRKSDAVVVSTLPDYTVHLKEHDGPVTVDSIDSPLERNALNLMQELGVDHFLLLRAGGIQADNEISIAYPARFQRAVELGLYRTLTHEKRDKRTRFTKNVKRYAAPVAIWLSLVLLSSLAHSDDLPRAFIRTYPILFQPTNFPIIRFWDGSTVKNASFTGTSLNINCTGGCGGAATFADASAFTFGTTSISNTGFVVDDVGTNTVAENSAGAPRMNTNRILYINPRNNAGTEIPFPAALGAGGGLKIDGSGTALPVSGTVSTTPPSNASENITQFGGVNISTGVGVSGTGIPRVTVSSDSSLAANQSVNLNQVAGAGVATGNGTAAGSVRVSVASDSTGTIIATQATAANLNARTDTSGATAAAVPARADYIAGNDGTNLIGAKTVSAANLSLGATNLTGVILVDHPCEWFINHVPALATVATVSRAANASGRHVAKFYMACYAAGGTGGPANVFRIRDGATGAGTVLWAGALAAINNSAACITGEITLIGTINTAMTIEFTIAGAATTQETV